MTSSRFPGDDATAPVPDPPQAPAAGTPWALPARVEALDTWAGDAASATTSSSASASATAASSATADELIRALETLRTTLDEVRLPLDVVGVDGARRDLGQATAQFDDYLLPRLRSTSAPLLVVVGGSTGAGKSTLVNSLLGEAVSAPGVLRPTTRAPVLVYNPADERWFADERILPGLARITAHGGTGSPAVDATKSLRLVASATLPPGMALIDAPDIDSVETSNRELATQLLAAADLWLFVTTAARYADAVPWELLHRAVERRAQVALVIDRVDPGTEVVAEDLRRMMTANGLGGAPLFLVPEAPLADGMLPEWAIGDIARWLTALGADSEARFHVAQATRDGVVDDLVRVSGTLVDAANAQHGADARLRQPVRIAYEAALAQVAAATSDGAMLRGEVLSRWQDFVGTSEFFRAVEHGVGRIRDAVVSFFRGSPSQAPQVEVAIAHGLESVVLDAADSAAERTFTMWRADPAAVGLLGGVDLSRSSADLRAVVGDQIRAWQGDVLELIREKGASKRGMARALSLGINTLGISLMIVVFASTWGLTGAEIGIAGGTALVGQKLLEAVFGDDAVRQLTKLAREQLATRVATVYDAEAQRYLDRLDELGVADADKTAARVGAAAQAVTAAAHAERTHRPVPLPPRTERVHQLRGATAQISPPTDAPEDIGEIEAVVVVGDESGAVDGDGAPAKSERRGWRRWFGRSEA